MSTLGSECILEPKSTPYSDYPLFLGYHVDPLLNKEVFTMETQVSKKKKPTRSGIWSGGYVHQLKSLASWSVSLLAEGSPSEVPEGAETRFWGFPCLACLKDWDPCQVSGFMVHGFRTMAKGTQRYQNTKRTSKKSMSRVLQRTRMFHGLDSSQCPFRPTQTEPTLLPGMAGIGSQISEQTKKPTGLQAPVLKPWVGFPFSP